MNRENFEKLYVEYIDFVRNVNEKMTASVGEISKASELSELQVITKTADQEDPSHTKFFFLSLFPFLFPVYFL